MRAPDQMANWVAGELARSGVCATQGIALDPRYFTGRAKRAATRLAFLRHEDASIGVYVDDELQYLGRDIPAAVFAGEVRDGWRRLNLRGIKTPNQAVATAISILGLDGRQPRLPSQAAPEQPRARVYQEPPRPDRRGRKSAGIAERFGRDLTALAGEGGLPPLIGREQELKSIGRILTRMTKCCPLLVGEPGVGKTAIAEGFAQRIVVGQVPESLRGCRVVEVNLGLVFAGASALGEMEARVAALVAEAKADRRLILFLDELHLIARPHGPNSVADLLKADLAGGRLRIIGALTPRDYRQHLEPDGALSRRFQVVPVREPTEVEAVAVLRGWVPRLSQHHGVEIDEDVAREAVRLARRYLPGRFLPDSAVDLLDEACAWTRLQQEEELHAPAGHV